MTFKMFSCVRCVVFVGVVFFFAPGMMQSLLAQAPDPERTWGLCIGIADYEPKDLNLKWADVDASVFCSYFLRYGLNVPDEHYQIVKNSDATLERITKELAWLNGKARENDRVYIFYAGHGKPESPILPHNSSKLLSKEEIQRLLGKIDAKEVIFIADACYSGKLAGRGARRDVEEKKLTGLSRGIIVEMAKAKVGTVIITSANGIQEAIEVEERKNGLFTYHLMNTLMKEERYPTIDLDKNGLITLYEVYKDVYASVNQESEQQPQISDEGKAKQIVLLSYRKNEHNGNNDCDRPDCRRFPDAVWAQQAAPLR